MIRAGRGFGKTRTGAEYIRHLVDNGYRRIALVAPTSADARDVMIEGESGLMNICPPDEAPEYEPSKRRLTWPCGAIAVAYSADEPRRLNGPQHDAAWCDEIGIWRYPQEAWDMLSMGLRLGKRPICIITTTPKNSKLVRELNDDPTCAVSVGSTYDNIANLAPRFFDTIKHRYEGTRIGRQELYAEILDDVEGALWSRELIERNRINENAREIAKQCKRIVVAVDPSGSRGDTGDEIGIVVCGQGERGEGYVLDDRTLRASPQRWAAAACEAYYDWQADHIVYESNFGGAMCEHTLKTIDNRVPLVEVHASRGKFARAEPIVSLYEQGKVHHVGNLAKLEDEQCAWVNGESDWSPNRMDAVVWALTDLMLGNEELWGF